MINKRENLNATLSFWLIISSLVNVMVLFNFWAFGWSNMYWKVVWKPGNTSSIYDKMTILATLTYDILGLSSERACNNFYVLLLSLVLLNILHLNLVYYEFFQSNTTNIPGKIKEIYVEKSWNQSFTDILYTTSRTNCYLHNSGDKVPVGTF